MPDAKTALKAAALDTLARRGIAGTSARTIAEAAGLSQGLVFYHFGSVNGLLEAAATEVAEARAAVYRDRLAQVQSLGELAGLARQLHEEERELGNVAVLAQLLAGAHTHPELAPVARRNYDRLVGEVRQALQRLLGDSALASALPAEHLAHAVSAAFIGIELLPPFDDVPDAAPELFDTLVELARLVDGVLDLGPTVTAALRRRLARDARRR
jgi:AcrR family transcriptional regulator